jgi:hypothetical protein
MDLMALGAWTTNFASGTNVTVPVGSNRYALVVFCFTCTSLPTNVTATLGGVSMTALTRLNTGVSGTVAVIAPFYLLEATMPASGSRAVVTTITGGAGLANAYRAFNCSTDRDQVAPTVVTDGDTGTVTAPTGLTFVDDDYGVSVVMANGSRNFTQVGSPQAVTERWDSGLGHSGADCVFSGSGAQTVTWTASAAAELIALLMKIPAIVVGPTITTQPADQISRLNGDVSGPAVQFVVEATGTTISDVTWEVDGTPISDGGIYDINTVIAPGDASVISTLTVTPTTKVGSPSDVEAAVEDANGTTNSSVATLTVYTGAVAAPNIDVSDASGQGQTSVTNDEPNDLIVTVGTGASLSQYITNRFNS